MLGNGGAENGGDAVSKLTGTEEVAGEGSTGEVADDEDGVDVEEDGADVEEDGAEGEEQDAAGGERDGVVNEKTVANVSWLSVSTSLLAAGSISSLKWRRKSTPTIGKETAASKNVHLNRRPWKDSVITFSPHEGMSCPAAPRSLGPEGGAADWCGNIEKLAPVSIKKRLLNIWSTMCTREPGTMALRRPWSASFPRCMEDCTWWLCRRKSNGRSRGRIRYGPNPTVSDPKQALPWERRRQRAHRRPCCLLCLAA